MQNLCFFVTALILLYAVYDICRLQNADCRLQTADCKLQTGLTREILLTLTSSSTTFPAQNNINLVAKILLDFLWWFTVMVLDWRKVSNIRMKYPNRNESYRSVAIIVYSIYYHRAL